MYIPENKLYIFPFYDLYVMREAARQRTDFE